MSIGRLMRVSATRGIWRRLTSIAVAYALIIQTVCIAFVGAQLTANAADNGLPGFELCLNGSQDGAPSPAGAPGHHDDSHCVFCSVAHHCLGAPPQSAFHRLRVQIAAIWSPVDDWRPPTFDQHSNVQPRGPPLGV